MLAFSIFNSSIDSDQLCDIIRSQFQCYQLEDIPESLYIAESIVEKKQSEQASYWKQVFELCEFKRKSINIAQKMPCNEPILKLRWELKGKRKLKLRYRHYSLKKLSWRRSSY